MVPPGRVIAPAAELLFEWEEVTEIGPCPVDPSLVGIVGLNIEPCIGLRPLLLPKTDNCVKKKPNL
jgi:hypothetical protein